MISSQRKSFLAQSAKYLLAIGLIAESLAITPVFADMLTPAPTVTIPPTTTPDVEPTFPPEPVTPPPLMQQLMNNEAPVGGSCLFSVGNIEVSDKEASRLQNAITKKLNNKFKGKISFKRSKPITSSLDSLKGNKSGSLSTAVLSAAKKIIKTQQKAANAKEKTCEKALKELDKLGVDTSKDYSCKNGAHTLIGATPRKESAYQSCAEIAERVSDSLESNIIGVPNNRVEADVELSESTASINATKEQTQSIVSNITGRGITVAVVDTGVSNHPTFSRANCQRALGSAGNMTKLIAGFDAIGESGFGGTTFNPLNDGHGHGTHVAGILAGCGPNAQKMGVAPGARIVAIKVLGTTGSGSNLTVTAGLQALSNLARVYDVKVVNMSLGMGGLFTPGNVSGGVIEPEVNLIHQMGMRGISFAISAGNNGDNGIHRPQRFNPLALGALSFAVASNDLPSMKTSAFSSAAPSTLEVGVDADGGNTVRHFQGNLISAPGRGICSSLPKDGSYLEQQLTARGNFLPCSQGLTYEQGRWAHLNGTSMAAPHVAGAVALLQEASQQTLRRKLTAAEMIALVQSTSRLFSSPRLGGNGVIDVVAAMQKLQSRQLPPQILSPQVNQSWNFSLFSESFMKFLPNRVSPTLFGITAKLSSQTGLARAELSVVQHGLSNKNVPTFFNVPVQTVQLGGARNFDLNIQHAPTFSGFFPDERFMLYRLDVTDNAGIKNSHYYTVGHDSYTPPYALFGQYWFKDAQGRNLETERSQTLNLAAALKLNKNQTISIRGAFLDDFLVKNVDVLFYEFRPDGSIITMRQIGSLQREALDTTGDKRWWSAQIDLRSLPLTNNNIYICAYAYDQWRSTNSDFSGNCFWAVQGTTNR